MCSSDLEVEVHRPPVRKGDVRLVEPGQELGQGGPQIYAGDGRGGLVSPEAEQVARRGRGGLEQAVVLRDPQHDGGQEGQEHDVAPMAVGRLQEVVALAVHQGHVDVLPASVHPLEGLLVEEQAQVVLTGQLPHRLHEDLVLIAGRVRKIGRAHV